MEHRKNEILDSISFSGEAAQNYETKCHCVLVLDVSGSMEGKPIQDLNQGLRVFKEAVMKDETTKQRLELSIITFADIPELIQRPDLVENITMPTLEATYTTAMVDAIEMAIKVVEERKVWYKETGQHYYRPIIVMITDGVPNEDQDIDGMSVRIKQDIANKHYSLIPIAVEGADLKVLKDLTGIDPLKLKDTNFENFFKWLSNSVGAVTKANPGEKVTMTQGLDSWLDNFEI